MEFKNIFEWFLIISNSVVVAVHLRSLFYLWTTRNKIKIEYSLMISIPLICSMSYCLINSTNLLTLNERFPLAWLGALGLSIVSYILTKILHDNLMSIEKVIPEKVYDDLDEDMRKAIASDNEVIEEVAIISLIEKLEMNKTQKITDKVAIRKIPNAVEIEGFHTIIGTLLNKAELGLQKHSDAHEKIDILKGVVLETYSKKIYKEGDTINIPPGRPHGFKALEYTELRGCFNIIK